MKRNYKPFDLKAAKNGVKVVTRNGKTARIVCFDAEREHPIVTLIRVGSFDEVHTHDLEGKYSQGVSYYDLFMAPVKHEGWIVLCEYDAGIFPYDDIFDTKDKAEKFCTENNHLTVCKIEWEE